MSASAVATPLSRFVPVPPERARLLRALQGAPQNDGGLFARRSSGPATAFGYAGASTFTPAPVPRAPALPPDFVDRPGRRGPTPPPPVEGPFGELRDEALEDAIGDYTTSGKRTVRYDRARDILFGELDVDAGKVRCVYTHREIPGGRTPSSNDMNVEHTWPQSKGATGAAKSDLHHLYPTDAKANSTRGNHPFGEVVNVKWQSPGGAKLGTDASGRTVFEPPEEHKGNVARALFYFSTTYDKPISAAEERALKAWNLEDPVDAAELGRNAQIFTYQNNRNPFVEDASLAARISDF